MYFGYYYGAPPDVVVTPPDPTPPDPIPSPITYADPEYVGHVKSALSKLPEQFKRLQNG